MKTGTLERLKFLVRIIEKEIDYLDYSSAQLFTQNRFDNEIETIDQNPQLATELEAYTSRFCRLQDTIGDKLLPVWLRLFGEQARTAIENLDRAEQLGLLTSADQWMELREIRNRMVHEYIESLPLLKEAITKAHAGEVILKDFARKLIDKLKIAGFIA